MLVFICEQKKYSQKYKTAFRPVGVEGIVDPLDGYDAS